MVAIAAAEQICTAAISSSMDGAGSSTTTNQQLADPVTSTATTGGWSLLPSSPGNVSVTPIETRSEAEPPCCRELTPLAAGAEQDSSAAAATKQLQKVALVRGSKTVVPRNELSKRMSSLPYSAFAAGKALDSGPKRC
eukprot:6175097-Pleurochrysis_carterae.AAC.5